MAKKRNWDKIANQNPTDSVKYRDVYDDQQFDRGKIQDKQSPASRIVLAVFCTLIVMSMVWFITAGVQFGVGLRHGNASFKPTTTTSQSEVQQESEYPPYIAKVEGMLSDADGNILRDENGVYKTGWGYCPVDKDGNVNRSRIYANIEDVPIPEWYKNQQEVTEANSQSEDTQDAAASAVTYGFGHYMAPDALKVILTFMIGILFFVFLYQVLMRNLDAQNMMNDTSDINQYQNDQHIQLPEEMQRSYDWFPDVGAHSSVSVSSMISHMALKNKGIHKVRVPRRADKDIFDDDGDIVYYKGEILRDENDNPIYETKPMIDEKFMDDLFEASGAPKSKSVRKYYDATAIPYNPGNKNRDKLKGYDTVADLINNDWELPDYEPQRPAGAYIVDTQPVNTMVLAITRAGKGQTVIEPTIDMWMREKNPNNMVINDPKGELIVKNYVRGAVRGFQLVQFNLINPIKTDIYNPLILAADAAREGDFTKTAMYVSNIAEVFFPLDGAEDPVWPNAANNAFKRAAYGLIDYYIEEEKELRLYAEKTHMNPKVLESKVDEMWGKVTLYNCYQLFVQLTSKKLKNPSLQFAKDVKAGKYNNLSTEEYDILVEEVDHKSAVLWEDKPEVDLLTLYFNATAALPRNEMRKLVNNVNDALRSMSGAEKMMSSVYGIAITAMSFFTDPTISTLTSGTPTQNVDLAGLSFPRRMGVRFHSDYIKRYHLVAMQAKWDAFEDANFTKPLGKDFEHDDLIAKDGWARYYFKGKFKTDVAYLRLRIINPQSEMLIKTMYFKFTKGYQTSLDGRQYVTDPVLGTKIVKDGLLVELRPFKKKDGTIVYKQAKTTFPKVVVKDMNVNPHKEKVEKPAIISTSAKYSEKPKMLFLVTPPHLMSYAKLILILVKQLVDLNFDKSYLTKDDQKPLYKTRYMLDELGNLQSEGHGIAGFQTMLSIGLGQDQQFSATSCIMKSYTTTILL